MTYPGSVNIDKIQFTNLRYLTDGTTDSITNANFDLKTGKPKNNLSKSNIIDTFFTNVASNLKENKNVSDNFIYKYPKVLEIDALRDIQVMDETTIDVVFILEGATMKNMFGYYMYYVDSDGKKQLLSNAKDTYGYYYTPTVIYPHVYSDTKDPNTLEIGQTRRLIGNLPNGNFSNIYIGFFLIPHGWFAFQENSEIYDHNILYSTVDFNVSYTETDFQIANDKIYSVFARAVDSKGNDLLFTAFEDVFIDDIYDLDYNDCVVGFIISNTKNVACYDDYSKVDVNDPNNDPDDGFDSPTDNTNNIICIDDNGEYVRLKKSLYNITKNNSYCFERHMYFDNIEDRDATFDACDKLLANYKNSYEKKIENEIPILMMRYLFRSNDLKKNEDSDEYKIYLFESVYSNHLDSSIIEKYKEITCKNFQNPNYYEKYRLFNTDTYEELIHLTEVLDLPLKSQENKFRIIGNGVMDCLSGKSHLPASKSQIYKVYKVMAKTDTNSVVINVKMDVHPTGYMSGKKTFLRYVSFVSNTKEHLIVDLGNLNLYQEINGTLNSLTTTSFSNIIVSEIFNTSNGQKQNEIKMLINVLKNDSNATYRIITINNILTFYCIRFPNIKNIPTMVFLNTALSLEWNNKYNITDGTYYHKQTMFPISSFKDV